MDTLSSTKEARIYNGVKTNLYLKLKKKKKRRYKTKNKKRERKKAISVMHTL